MTLSPRFAETRGSLHALGEHVPAATRYHAIGRIGLQVAPGGGDANISEPYLYVGRPGWTWPPRVTASGTSPSAPPQPGRTSARWRTRWRSSARDANTPPADRPARRRPLPQVLHERRPAACARGPPRGQAPPHRGHLP